MGLHLVLCLRLPPAALPSAQSQGEALLPHVTLPPGGPAPDTEQGLWPRLHLSGAPHVPAFLRLAQLLWPSFPNVLPSVLLPAFSVLLTSCFKKKIAILSI